MLVLLACGPGAPAPGADLGTPLPEAEVVGVYADLESRDPARIEAALARIAASGEQGDRRFVAVLIEGLRIAHLDERESQAYNARVVALERLSGEGFGGDWFRWAEWYEATAFEPPPGFLDYKGRLFSRVDPGFAKFLHSAQPSRLRAELIRWGGVAPGAIPALDEPGVLTVSDSGGARDAGALADTDAVVGLVHGGEARAYPLRILDWHELVNDRVGGEAVALAYCTLCGSAIAYRAGPHRFETSGLLYRSNKLMFDRETNTLWSQLEGRPLLGPLVESDIQLEALPAVVTTWRAWREQHPETTVLSFETGHEREYTVGMPYGGYFATHKLLFPAGARDERLPAKAQVYGLAQDGAARAWPLDALVEARVVNHAIGDTALVLVATRGSVELEGRAPQTGVVTYRAGAEVRAFRADPRHGPFRASDDPDRVLDAAGRPWRVGEAALVGPDGQRAGRVPGGIVYWFAWQALHPETELHGDS